MNKKSLFNTIFTLAGTLLLISMAIVIAVNFRKDSRFLEKPRISIVDNENKASDNEQKSSEDKYKTIKVTPSIKADTKAPNNAKAPETQNKAETIKTGTEESTTVQTETAKSEDPLKGNVP